MRLPHYENLDWRLDVQVGQFVDCDGLSLSLSLSLYFMNGIICFIGLFIAGGNALSEAAS